MKKYRFAFPVSSFVVFGLIVVSAIVAIVFASLRLAGVGDFASAYPATDVVTICAFVAFLALIAWDLFASYYAFEEDSFLSAQLFSRKRIARDRICKLVIDETTGFVVLYYADPMDPETLLYLTVNIKKKYVEAFAEDFRSFRPDLPVEYEVPSSDGEGDA